MSAVHPITRHHRSSHNTILIGSNYIDPSHLYL